MPAFPLHGNNFRKGVKFSVQTTSRGRVPCSRKSLTSGEFGRMPVGSKVIRGLVVRVESMKLREAQNSPERALFKVTHRANDLDPMRNLYSFLRCLLTQPRIQPLPKPTAPRQSLPLWSLPKALCPSYHRPIFRY